MALQIREPDTARKAQQPVDTFPVTGNVRAKQAAEYLAIGLSTWWLYSKQGRIQKPMKYGARVSVWPAEYIRDLAVNGIPEKEMGQ